ncbi:HNH endonuclease [Pantoea sp. EKM21T]|uniref:HNH endonuclease signature motif containing protein n=1 Tax=unclassified Pantoea TaxID=2630326 RepID=UPI00142E1AD4|nr:MULTISPECIES: HNH endonuclease signature motif containing protein [unclassified Pantoea]KAF6676198.1 HNH endonuclease [Pantoea sp. EKM21T]KAF6680842.1 HNH endonuclease [Pantoea sp. EKM22T]
MKMTRLEAIKAWGRASREGKPIPDEVREVLLSTQNDSRHDFHIESPTVKVRVSNEQAKRNVNGNKLLTAPVTIRSVGAALNPEQMEIYNQKRKLDNQQRKHNPQLYSNILLELISSGLSRKQATKKAKTIFQGETLDRFNKEKRKSAEKSTSPAIYRGIFNDEIIKPSSRHLAKVKQKETNQADNEQKKIDAVLIRRPISCIECKIDFEYFGRFVDHTKDIHRTSISTPKLIIEIETPVAAADNVIDPPVLPSNETVEEAFSIRVAETSESFSDKWIRLFAENGYTVAMVDAFKREATKQGMDVKQAHEFLSVCKPSKHLIETPVRPQEVMILPEQTNAITSPLEKLVDSVANDASYIPALSESIEQALFSDRIVRTRTNQNDFKERVAANFGYRCAITNSGEALEAAHIEPVRTGNNNTSNGLLMLACLHRLFDAGLMGINPHSLTVHFKPDCTYFAKSILEGKKLNVHSVTLNISGLLERWLSFEA